MIASSGIEVPPACRRTAAHIHFPPQSDFPRRKSNNPSPLSRLDRGWQARALQLVRWSPAMSVCSQLPRGLYRCARRQIKASGSSTDPKHNIKPKYHACAVPHSLPENCAPKGGCSRCQGLRDGWHCGDEENREGSHAGNLPCGMAACWLPRGCQKSEAGDSLAAAWPASPITSPASPGGRGGPSGHQASSRDLSHAQPVQHEWGAASTATLAPSCR